MSTELPRDLGEDQVRDLLHHAARTIDVGPAAPVVDTAVVDTARAPRRWVPAALVAAALVVAAAVTGLVLTRGDQQVEPATGTLPPVIGLYQDEATTRVQAAGYRVRVVDVPGCLPSGGALGAVREGREVALRVAGPGGTCPSPDPSVTDTAWRFLGILSQGPGIPLADAVSLTVDGGTATSLTPEEVVDLDAWGDPAAEALRSALDDPDVEVRWTSRVDCDAPLPETTGDGFVLVRPDDPCGVRVDLSLDPSGAVAGIDVVTRDDGDGGDGDAGGATVPDLTGLPADEARAAAGALVDPGRVYLVYLEAGCAEPVVVTEQDPRPGTRLRPQDSFLLTIETDRAACTKPASAGAVEQQVGQQLVDFADGGPAPAFADQVRLFLGRAPAGVLTAEEAADPDSWVGCPPTSTGVAGGSCPTDILSVLAPFDPNPYDVAVRAEPVANPCGSWLRAARLPSRITAYDTFFLSPPAEQITCATGFRMQVFLDGQQRITAVDLERTEP